MPIKIDELLSKTTMILIIVVCLIYITNSFRSSKKEVPIKTQSSISPLPQLPQLQSLPSQKITTPRESNYLIPLDQGVSMPFNSRFNQALNLNSNCSPVWHKIGLLLSTSLIDDTVFNLERKCSYSPYQDTMYDYRCVDTYNNTIINLSSLSDTKLRDGEVITVPGKESLGTFDVVIDTI